MAIGQSAGATGQGGTAVAIGQSAGQAIQGATAVAIGQNAGRSNQGGSAVAIGQSAGATGQGGNSVAIGISAGQALQASNAIAIGNSAGQTSQTAGSIAIGYFAGATSLGTGCVAIGYQAGQTLQGNNCVAIGVNAASTGQGNQSVAIGLNSGGSTQGVQCVSIGNGSSTGGNYSISIGPSATSNLVSTIVLNAQSSGLASVTANAFYAAPIRVSAATTAATGALLLWNSGTKEIISSSAATSAGNKSFIIDHPDNPNKHLVHVCLEGPEVGIYYRGKGEITNNHHVIISLPDYVKKIGRDFTIHTTPITTGKTRNILSVSEVINNQFIVYGDNGRFNWVAYGKRGDITVEPLKSDIKIAGDGPYKWIKEYTKL